MEPILSCPGCAKTLRMPPGLAGQSVQCPACGAVWAVPGDPSLSPPVGEPDPVAPESVIEPHLLKAIARWEPCPACGVWMPRDSLRCPACNAKLDEYEEGERPWENPEGPGRLDAEPHRGNLVHNLGLACILCVPAAGCLGFIAFAAGFILGLTAWLLASSDLAKMRAGLMDRHGEELTQWGRSAGLVGMALNAVGMLACAALGIFLIHFLP
jgi:hypothetical protein